MGNSVATIPLPDRQSPNIVEAFPNDGSTSFKFSLEGRTVYALRGIEASRLFHDPASPVSTLGAFPSHLDAFYGMGTFPSVRSVLLMEGTQHHTAKAELLLAVASEKVAAHCAGVASVLDQTWADWKGTSGKLQERCKQIALRASARCVLGITAETKLRQLDAIASGFSLFDLVGDAAVASSVRDALVGIVDQQTEIESSPDTVEGGGLDDAVLDILMHAADSMNCETVAIVTVHMFVLLWEALARVLVSIVKQLEQHPDIREELRKEAQDAHKANPGCTAANSVLVGSTKQLSFFVKEIKRTTQIAPLPFRRMTDQCDVGGEHFEKDTIVCLATPLMHMDSEQYVDPEKFDPSRFSRDRAEDKQKNGWCWLPHGTGSKNKGHRCASEELTTALMKTLIVTLLQSDWKHDSATGDWAW